MAILTNAHVERQMTRGDWVSLPYLACVFGRINAGGLSYGQEAEINALHYYDVEFTDDYVISVGPAKLANVDNSFAEVSQEDASSLFILYYKNHEPDLELYRLHFALSMPPPLSMEKLIERGLYNPNAGGDNATIS